MQRTLKSLFVWLQFAALAAAGAVFVSDAVAQPRNPAPEAEICQGCHADRVESYKATKHGQVGNQKGPDCVTCHGPALEHAKSGGGKGVGGIIGFNNKSVPAAKKTETCLACHQGNRHLAFWESGSHSKNDVACSDCHSLHTRPGPGATIALKKPNPTIAPVQTTERQLEYETCTGCHKQIRAQLIKTSHHPIIEGKVSCSSCHNPHGALSKSMINAESVTQLCTTCHAEKRGPFVWGHPPAQENCLTCHQSHGSNHPRLLVEKTHNLCQDCHDASRHPGTIYDATGSWLGTKNTRLIARGCVNCHNQVHGSNAPAMRGKFFLR